MKGPPLYMIAEDLTVGILDAMEHPPARNETFNAMTPNSKSRLELAPLIWDKVKGLIGPFPTSRSRVQALRRLAYPVDCQGGTSLGIQSNDDP